MSKLMTSLLELMRELHMVKGILKDRRGVHMVVKGSLGSSHKKKKNAFKYIEQRKSKARKEKSKRKGKCFSYGKRGH